MPEHGEGTPEQWRRLESFLWHDLDNPEDWSRWAARILPDLAADAAEAGLTDAMRLHAALRSLQAANSGIAADMQEPRTTLNRLVVEHDIRPRLDGHGTLRLVPASPIDPVGAATGPGAGGDAGRRLAAVQAVPGAELPRLVLRRLQGDREDLVRDADLRQPQQDAPLPHRLLTPAA